MYKEFKGLDLPTIDKEILAFWDANDIFHKSVQQRPEDNRFVFYEGPPSANGQPGIHHVMARAVKDLFCRFQSMQGKRVERKGGWDTHGLPIELNVEKELGITKEDIGVKITVDEYNQKCRETVMRFKDRWDDITRKMGYWVDLDNPYITFENSYIESVWWLLNELYHKGLLYKGYTIQPYSPAAGTGLSSHELNLPGCYREVSDQSVVAQFKVKRNDHSAFLFDEVKEGEVYFLAWTTTPWTLPSNTALAVGGGIDYVRVFTYNPYTKLPVNLILAKDLLKAWFKPEAAEASFEEWTPDQKLIPYRVTAEYRGATLEGVDYEQLMPYVQPEDGDAFKVLVGDFVSTEDGTGIVHIAPSFGADDMRVAKKYGIGALTLVDRQGKFVDEVTDYAGRYVKDYKNEGKDFVSVDIDIVVQLKKENKAFSTEKYVHNYPHCWRTDKPVLYYPLDSWFIRASAFKERMYELNQTINWKPASTGEGRFGKWLENLQDWNLSRSRFWGIPLPIWRTKDGAYENCIDSVEELRKEIEKANKALGMSQTVPKDLHRPYIDEIVLVAENGEPMYREPDLIDVWFDSGAMPYAQWHYPFENKEKFGHSFPADFIAEGVDQTRGWFYTLHAIATMVFDSVAFKTVVSNGLVLDANGDKMSKSKGNVVDPFATIEKYSADCTRWYMISNAPPWDNLRFDTKGIEEVRRKFFGTLYNTYSFFALYANIDKFEYREADLPLEKRHESDRWIISELNTLVKNVTADFADYEPTSAVRRIEHFVDAHLSNWYVRLNRRRFWKGDYTDDKIAAYQTLYNCLVTISKLMAPVAPFFSDWLYRNLNEATKKEAQESVHLTYFPKADEKVIDKALEQRMEYAQDICSLVLSLRKRENIRVRQPLHKILLPVLDPAFKPQVEAVRELILAEVNIKDIEYLEDTAGFLKKKIKPNFKTLGKRLGKDMKAAADHIAAMSQEAINQIEKTGRYELHINGTSYELALEDFEIAAEDIPGWLVASDGVLTVALDITLTPELLAEGMAREIVNRIQNIRKNSDFNVTDRIEVAMTRHPEVETAVAQFGEYIKNETLANAITFADNVEGEEVELVQGVVIRLSVNRGKPIENYPNSTKKSDMNINYPNILNLIKGYNLPGRSESAAFLMWYLENFYRLEPEEAIESVCDQPGDRGIDGIYLNEANGTIDVFQSKISQSEGRTIGDKSLREFHGSLSQLKTKDSIQSLLNTSTDASHLANLVKRLDLINNIDAYSIRGIFVCNSEIDSNGIAFLSAVVDIEFVGKFDIESSYISAEKGIPSTIEAKFNVETASITKYFVDTETLAIIAPIKAIELVKMTGIADQSVFAYNVRGPLGNTKVNKDIVNSIKNPAFHKQFPLFHNGITIVSNELKNSADDEITIKTFYVVNGCQSLTALYRNKNYLTEDLNILVKFIKVDVNSNLSKIITKFSNNQNGVKARDFKSTNKIQIRLQNEINQYYSNEYFFEIQRGEDPQGLISISNEQTGIRLMAFDLKEPWNTRRKYQVFDEKYNEIFSRPEVDAHRVVLLEIIEDRIQNSLNKIKNPLVSSYGMTKYMIFYIIRKIFDQDELGVDVLTTPSKYTLEIKNKLNLERVLDRLIEDIIIDLNGEIENQGENFDYKSKYRDKDWIENISKDIVSNHQKLVMRQRILSLKQEFEK